MAESEIRSMYGALRAADLHQVEGDSLVGAWSPYFWRQNFRISPCELSPPAAAQRRDDPEHEDPDARPPAGDSEDLTVEGARRQLVSAGARLAQDLAEAQQRLELDVYAPEADEVKLGLAGRQIRLLRLLLSDPHLWTGSTGAHVLRSLVDGLITTTWLVQKNDVILFERFRQYGLGKLKLYKLHLEDHLDRQEEPSAEQIEFLESIEEEVSQELLEEFIDIDLGGTFAGVDTRQMAIDTDLKPFYDLGYQPYSSEAHGDWVSLRRSDLRPCANPLHRFHRVAHFGSRPQAMHLEVIEAATEIVEKAVTTVFASYGQTVADAFERFHDQAFGLEPNPELSSDETTSG